jgi:Uma2 family endonuclease
MKAHKLPILSIKEYIQHEIENGLKYEYHNGKIYALAGGSLNHGLLCGNIYSELRSSLKNKNSNCKPLTSEIKLNIQNKNSFVYPDTMVICGEIETSKNDKNSVTNPILIVEVLSKSTSDYDRGDKFYFYRQIETLQEYILIEQDKYVVEVYYKKPKSDLWRISRFEGFDEKIKIQSLDISISMKDLYFDVEIENMNN